MDLAANLEAVRARIAAASRRAGRDAASVTLMPVSKGQTPQTVQAAAALGLGCFAENRVQEAKVKIGQCPGRLRWHLIGHLQSNKARDAVHFFEMIQSVDSLDLAIELEKWADRAAKTLPILLQVNVAGESTKFGYPPDRVLDELEEINRLKRLEIHGLMTIAPWTPEVEKVRPVFRRLRELKERREQQLSAPLPHLSMGMTSDFEVAIEEKTTMVRIGTALFGPRGSRPEPGTSRSDATAPTAPG